MGSKGKLAVGRVVALTWQPAWRPEYGRIVSVDAENVMVRFYDSENGDFYDRPLKHDEVRPLTAREAGPARGKRSMK
jgi:hypothetical protein